MSALHSFTVEKNGVAATVVNCDNVAGLRALPSDCVTLTVTSPPYDDRRTYNGFSVQWESLFAELFRVTKPGGIVVWVVADATYKGHESLTSFKQVFGFVGAGFGLCDTMIFERTTHLPFANGRYPQAFEFMFVFVKGLKPAAFNPVQEPTANPGLTRKVWHRNQAGDFHSIKEKTTGDSKPKNNVWRYATSHEVQREGTQDHPAVFPLQLAIDHVLSWSNPVDLVIDPFSGSGTTAKACILHGRNFVGFELSREYCDLSETRLRNTAAE